MTHPEASAKLLALKSALKTVIRGQDSTLDLIISCFAAGGHLLLEDHPGTGKTTLAKTLAKSIGDVQFSRLQFTPDLLPSDVLGVSIFDPSSASFRFHKGPIFTDLLLADEINRASPRTQSALLEAMAEAQATIEGTQHHLSDLFFVIATQNPVEFRGTFPLPEAQMDRFTLQCRLGYLNIDEEVAMLAEQQTHHPLDSLTPVCSRTEVLAIRQLARSITITEELRHYLVTLVNQTRQHPQIKLPASPRASLALMQCAQALALLEGRDFVTPASIQQLAHPVLAHRLILENDAQFSGQSAPSILEEILRETPIPV